MQRWFPAQDLEFVDLASPEEIRGRPGTDSRLMLLPGERHILAQFDPVLAKQ